MAKSRFNLGSSKVIKDTKKLKEKPKKKKKEEKLEKEVKRLDRRTFVRFFWKEGDFYFIVIWAKLLKRVVYKAKVKKGPSYEIDYTNRRYGANNIIHRHKEFLE